MINADKGVVASSLMMFLLVACEPASKATGPTVGSIKPSTTVTYDNGWNGILNAANSSESNNIVACLTPIAGILSVPWAGKIWRSINGPYHAFGRTLTSTQCHQGNHFPSVFASDDGARAAADWLRMSGGP